MVRARPPGCAASTWFEPPPGGTRRPSLRTASTRVALPVHCSHRSIGARRCCTRLSCNARRCVVCAGRGRFATLPLCHFDALEARVALRFAHGMRSRRLACALLSPLDWCPTVLHGTPLSCNAWRRVACAGRGRFATLPLCHFEALSLFVALMLRCVVALSLLCTQLRRYCRRCSVDGDSPGTTSVCALYVRCLVWATCAPLVVSHERDCARCHCAERHVRVPGQRAPVRSYVNRYTVVYSCGHS